MPDTKTILNLWSLNKAVGWTPSENQTVLEPKPGNFKNLQYKNFVQL